MYRPCETIRDHVSRLRTFDFFPSITRLGRFCLRNVRFANLQLFDYGFRGKNLFLIDIYFINFQVEEIRSLERQLQKEYDDLSHEQWEIEQRIIRTQATTEVAPVNYVNGEAEKDKTE